MAAVPARAAFIVEVDENTIQASAISGFDSGGPGSLFQPGDDALLDAIGGAERGNRPCFLRFQWLRNLGEPERFATRFFRAPCASDDDGRASFEETGLAAGSPVHGIGAIRVCDNDGNDQRLKGVEITEARSLSASGDAQPVVPFGIEGEFQRPNCRQWQNEARCDDNKVAIGVRVFDDQDGVSGLQLICATARVSDDAAPLALAPLYRLNPTAVTTALSGSALAGDTEVRVGPADNYAITQIGQRERLDHPCHLDVLAVHVRGPLIEDFNGEYHAVDAANLCNPTSNVFSPDGDRLTVFARPTDDYELTHSTERYLTFVSGVRICTNNDRLKGIEIEGRRIYPSNRTILVQGVPLAPGASVGERANCDDQWQPWALCPPRHVATGLLAYFDSDSPPSIKALGLECRNVVPESLRALSLSRGRG
jgi:hypothetical protein